MEASHQRMDQLGESKFAGTDVHHRSGQARYHSTICPGLPAVTALRCLLGLVSVIDSKHALELQLTLIVSMLEAFIKCLHRCSDHPRHPRQRQCRLKPRVLCYLCRRIC